MGGVATLGGGCGLAVLPAAGDRVTEFAGKLQGIGGVEEVDHLLVVAQLQTV